MSWFLSQVINGILQLVIALIVQLTNQLSLCLGFSPDAVRLYFPGIDTFTLAFKILAVFILITIVLWQLTKSIFGELSYGDKDNPVILLLRTSVALLLIFWSLSFMSYFFNAFTQPFYILTDDNNTNLAFDVTGDDNNIFNNTIEEAFGNFIQAAENSSEEEYNAALNYINNWIFPGVSILKSLIELICIGFLGFKFIFFLLSILERYLLLMLQTFLSPLVWPTIVSKATVGIFRKWFEILVSNFVIVYLNMWMLGLIVKSMAFIFSPNTEFINTDLKPSFILGVGCFYVMIRIAQSLSTYVSRILTGFGSTTGLGTEILMVFRSAQNSARNIIRGTGKVLHHVNSDQTDRSAYENSERYPDSNLDSRFKDPHLKTTSSNDTKNSDLNQEKDVDSGIDKENYVSDKKDTIQNTSDTSKNENILDDKNILDNSTSGNDLLIDSLEENSPWQELNDYLENDLSETLEDDKEIFDYEDLLADTGIDNLDIVEGLGADKLPLYAAKNEDDSYFIYGLNTENGEKERLGYLSPIDNTSKELKEQFGTVEGEDGSYLLVSQDKFSDFLEMSENDSSVLDLNEPAISTLSEVEPEESTLELYSQDQTLLLDKEQEPETYTNSQEVPEELYKDHFINEEKKETDKKELPSHEKRDLYDNKEILGIADFNKSEYYDLENFIRELDLDQEKMSVLSKEPETEIEEKDKNDEDIHYLNLNEFLSGGFDEE